MKARFHTQLCVFALLLSVCFLFYEQNTLGETPALQSPEVSAEVSAETKDADELEPMLCGGWTVQKELDDELLVVFQKGAAQVSEYRLSPLACSTQVVAGLNYCFLCTAQPQKNRRGVTVYAALNLYENLQGEVKVTGFRLIPMQTE